MTSATATRPQQLDEELRIHLCPSTLQGLAEAVEADDTDEMAECLIDLTEDLEALADEFPEDWEQFTGARTPAQMAASHLAWLLQA